MLPRRLVASLIFSLAVALVAAAGLAGSAASAAASGFGFGFEFGDRPHGPPPGWGHAPPPPPGWGRPRPHFGWAPPPPHFGRPGGWGACRSRLVSQPVVDPWGRVIRYRNVEVMDCGRPGFGPRW